MLIFHTRHIKRFPCQKSLEKFRNTKLGACRNILRTVKCADQSTKCCLKITAHIRASSSSLDLASKIVNEIVNVQHLITQQWHKFLIKQYVNKVYKYQCFFKSCVLFCAVYSSLSIHIKPDLNLHLQQNWHRDFTQKVK